MLNQQGSWEPRPAQELLRAQVQGMALWHTLATSREAAAVARALSSREARMDAVRTHQALKRANKALLAQADSRIADSRALLTPAHPRAVLVHRSEWVLDKLTQALAEQDIEVVAQLSDGADGVGITVVEQPELVLLEDLLPSMPGAEVARALRDVAPATVVVAHVSTDEALAEMLEAGAALAFHRRMSAHDIARQLSDYLRRPDEA